MRTLRIGPLVASVLFLIVGGPAQAVTYGIDAVLGNGGGMVASLFHEATGPGGMSGDKISDITTGSSGVSGSYDDVTGAFSATLPVASGGSFTLAGNLQFSGTLSSNSTLSLDFSAPSGLLQDTDLGFKSGNVCCNASDGPNSFVAGPGDSMIMSLWGANGFSGSFGGSYTNPTLGMDLRLRLTPSAVPIPAAAWLFGSALIGLVGVARRSRGRGIEA